MDGPLASLPSFHRVTRLPDVDRLALWWVAEGRTTLRLLTPDGDDVGTVPTDDLTEAPVPLFWTGDRFVVSTRPTTYLLDRDGSAEAVLPEDEYTFVHDVHGDRFLYVHYGNEWTLRLYDRATEERTVVDDDPAQSGHAGFDPDGDRLVYRRNPTTARGRGTLVLAAPDGTDRRELAVGDPDRRTRARAWHPDGGRLLVGDRSPGTNRIGCHDVERDETTWFEAGDHPEFPTAFAPDGERLFGVRLRNGYDLPVLYDVATGDGEELDLPRGRIGGDGPGSAGCFLDCRTLLVRHSSATEPPRLLRYDLRSDEYDVLLSTATDAVAERNFVEAGWVTYEAPDGFAVDAVLYRPNADPAPAVVYVHGGPHTFEGRGFDPLAQWLVSRGYAVLEPNYRGSTNRGRATERALVGELGRGDVDDVVAGARWLASRDWVDADRIAALGHSAGARIVYQLAFRHPEPFRLLVPENGSPDHGEVFDPPNDFACRLLADESEELPLLRGALNPMERIEDVAVPVCVIQGSEDPNVEQAERYAAALEERGWTEGEQFRFEVLDGAGHVVRDSAQFWSVLADAFEQYGMAPNG